MSRKSRQKKGRTLLQKVPPVGVCVFLLIAGLWIGTIFTLGPWISQPTPLEDTVPMSVTMQRVEGEYRKRLHGGFRLRNIYIYFAEEDELYIPDFDRLYISDVIAGETLLDKLKAYPAGTVFDVRLKPDSKSILTLSVDGVELLSYEQACRAINTNNRFGVIVGVFMLFVAGYAIWALVVTWRYRRLL